MRSLFNWVKGFLRRGATGNTDLQNTFQPLESLVYFRHTDHGIKKKAMRTR